MTWMFYYDFINNKNAANTRYEKIIHLFLKNSSNEITLTKMVYLTCMNYVKH